MPIKTTSFYNKHNKPNPGRTVVLFRLFACVSGVILLGFVDFYTGYEVSFSLFYLLPIAAASWFVGPVSGVLVSILSAMTWLAADNLNDHPYSSYLIPIWNSFIRLGFFIIITLLISRLHTSFRHEKELARTDPMTGAANSRYFYEMANFELARSRRSGRPLTLAYIDLDNFKFVNDHLGHSQGDDALKAVSKTVQKNMRANDVFARLGGDEFAIMLPDTNQAGARSAISKIHANLLEEMHRGNWPVTFSVGVVIFAEIPASVDEMVHLADQLMYEVKSGGRNAVRFEEHSG